MNVLKYVIAVAEDRSFTASAKRLYISQPSLSQSIRALEKQLGTELFDRRKTPLALTPAGDAYLKWARQVVQTQQQMEQQIADMSSGARTRLAIGASAERTRNLLPPVIKRFFELRPNCSIKIWDVPTADLTGLMDEEKIHLILGPPASDTVRYTSQLIGEERIVLAVPADDPLNLPPSSVPFPEVDLRRFKDSPFIVLSTQQGLGRLFLQYCDTCGFIPNIRVECRLLHNLYNLVAAGAGVGLVSTTYARRFRDDAHVRYYSLKDFSTTQPLAAVYRNDRYLSKDAEVMISLLRGSERPGR